MEASGPTRPLSFRESAIYGFGTLGASAVYSFLNSGAGLDLERYPAVPTWAVGLLSQERSLAGAFVQPIVGAMSDRTRTRIGRRKPFFIAGVALTAASLLFLSGFPPLVPMLMVLSINAFFLNVAVDPYTALMADIVPPEQRGRVGTILAVFNMAGQIGATLLAIFLWDRSPQLVFLYVAVIRVLSFSLIAFAASQVQTVPQALVAMGFVGIANGVWTALNIPLLVDLVPRERAAEMTGLGSGIWSLAQPVGAVVAGIMIGNFDSYRAAFMGAAAFVLVSFLLLLTVHAPHTRRAV